MASSSLTAMVPLLPKAQNITPGTDIRLQGLFQTAEEVSESALLSASTKPGDVKYVDVSGPDGTPDGIINETYDRVVLGSSLPHYLYGGSISLGWKGLSFSLLFNDVGKQLSRLTESMIRPMQGQWLPAPSVLLNDNGSRNYWSVYNTAQSRTRQPAIPTVTITIVGFWPFSRRVASSVSP